MNDTELIDDLITTVFCYYQQNFTGYDTHIDRENIKEHIIDIMKESVDVNGKINAIIAIAKGE